MYCSNCGSTDLKNKGIRLLGNKRAIKHICNVCGTNNYFDVQESSTIKNKNLVITSATDGFATNVSFLKTLKSYCKENNAELVVLGVINGVPFAEENFADEIKEFLVDKNINMNDNTVIMGSMKLNTNLESPIGGMKPFSKGKNVIFGHPQIQLRTLPRKHEKYPAVITTTGSVSIPKYGKNKSAYKAQFNHSYSAVFISGKNEHNIRHLSFDGKGFYDLDTYYFGDEIKRNQTIKAIITGDEHAIFVDPLVAKLTYGKGGLIDRLKPEFIIRHDVLDSYAISHHHAKNQFVKYKKYLTGMDSIEEELNQTLDFIIKTTPETSTSIIVSSNHNSHLLKWLNEGDTKNDMVNIKIYHELMWRMLEKIKKNPKCTVDPFELWAENKISENIKFLKNNDEFMIFDIDVSNHGDKGLNGTRGSILAFTNIPLKTIIGHSHSPGIEKGAYQVGTSSIFDLEYNIGLSSWHHSHCLIHQNGKRQLLFIVE